MKSIYSALIHYPVRDRAGEVATSAVTNMDVHDIARSTRTFGLKGYFVVSPIEAQRALVHRILEHWQTGAGARRVPERTTALNLCEPIESIERMLEAINLREGESPEVWVTAARAPPGKTIRSWAEGRAMLAARTKPIVLVFGTAHGLHSSVLASADAVLAPIRPGSDFNHLSVRAAAAITFDRLFGDG